MKTIKNRKGFSLVELLVVITIIAILSVVAYTAVGGNTIKARDSKRQQDLSTVQSALELYFVEFSRYPGSLDNGEATVGDGWKIPRKYLSSIPIDPKESSPSGADIKYYYFTDGDVYMIGATLENEGVGNETSYVVGNTDSTVALTPPTVPIACNMEVDTTTCLPYDFLD